MKTIYATVVLTYHWTDSVEIEIEDDADDDAIQAAICKHVEESSEYVALCGVDQVERTASEVDIEDYDEAYEEDK
jgi:hypothetical protein